MYKYFNYYVDFGCKKVVELSTNLNSRKEDLVEVINDAEQIVVEMNNFSNYLMQRIDDKTKEVEKVIELNKSLVLKVQNKKQLKETNETLFAERIQERIEKQDVKAKQDSRVNQLSKAISVKQHQIKIEQQMQKVDGKELINSEIQMDKVENAVGYQGNVYYPNKSDSKVKQNNYDKNPSKTTRTNKKIDLVAHENEVNLNEIYSISKDKVIPINPRYREVYSLFEEGYTELDIAKKFNMGLGEVKLILGIRRQ